jgi:hypothetical protein
MRLLMSLCNVGHFNSQFSLAVAEAGGAAPQLVDCSAFVDLNRDVGITGLCAVPGGLAVAVQSAHPKIVLLDDQFRVVKAIVDDRFADLHSLYVRDGYLFCLCSGNNKVIKVSLADHAVSLFWEYQIDTPFLHINSMVFHDGRPLVSSHKTAPEGPGRGESGGAWYLDDYSVLIPDLKQPHTLVEEDGAIYCLSSHDSRVVKWAGGKLSEVVVASYLRGLAFAGPHAVLGSSSRRFISRKHQGVRRYTDFSDVVGNDQYMSSLVIADRDFQVEERIDTTHLGFEIYDVVPDPGVPAALLVEDAAAVRMQTMQRQIIALRERLQTVRNQAG